jgi:predicted lipoprotein
MQSAAIGLEGLAVRLSEVTALYAARHEDAMTSADLASVADDVDTLRSDLVAAEASLRESLSSLD